MEHWDGRDEQYTAPMPQSRYGPSGCDVQPQNPTTLSKNPPGNQKGPRKPVDKKVQARDRLVDELTARPENKILNVQARDDLSLLASRVYNSANICLTLDLLLKRKGHFGGYTPHRLPFEPMLWNGLGDIHREFTEGPGIRTPGRLACRDRYRVADALMVLTNTTEDSEERAIERTTLIWLRGGLGLSARIEDLSKWVQALKHVTYSCIQENVQKLLSEGRLSPTGYDLLMSTRPSIPRPIVLEGIEVAQPEATNAGLGHITCPLRRGVDRALRELKNGKGGTDGIGMICSHLGHSPRLQSTRDCINAVLNFGVLEEGLYPTNRKAAIAYGVSLRSFLMWKYELEDAI